VQTRTLARRLARLDSEFDVALQVHGWVGRQPRPFALYVDQTRLMAERGWPQWMPFSPRERSELLALERAMYGDAAHLFAMGSPARESLVDDYGVDASRISVVGGGAGFDPLPPARAAAGEPAILFVGREFERKGGDDLLRAFERVRAEVPGARLDVVGSSRRIGAPGVAVHGRVADRGALSELYRSARAFCLPSRYEPYGLVLIEAMAHGVPCVGAAVQSIPEILDGGRAGVLVPPRDPGSLADALIGLLTDDALARRLGAAGRERVEASLTWDAVAGRIAPVLAALAAGPPSPAGAGAH
jgi:glycosyltransferase involved in cell wall biosynthesis